MRHERVRPTVREGAAFSTWLLGEAGFGRSDSLVLTEHSRYWLHDATIEVHRQAIGLGDAGADELLTGEAFKNGGSGGRNSTSAGDDRYARAALFLLGVHRALEPAWREELPAGEVIANTGPGMVAQCLPPGGVPLGAEQ
ncbi:hypothetical protein ABZ543_17665 [Streptomyces roseifaciens]